ncbi:hypothetical protein RRG08_028167 [Elysia crispata]|uniref:Reverse transcriptase domain-containing protein n=1 Tax=Elysia crispata TaxID=231223 RepID=A0AAE0YRE4_9GAST|nr:hypothetical protein RRG08_028167 [Elysia crispata]
MDQLSHDLPGVAVYIDDCLVSGTDADSHLQNLRRLLQRLEENGLRCRMEKCEFGKSFVEYLGHTLSREGIAKGPKVDAITKMPAPTNIPELRAFLGQIQFYGNLATVLEPLYNLTRKDSRWNERPIANVSKTLSPAQRRYSQIHKEALAIIFALTKFHQFLYTRKFILVTDLKPLLKIFSPHKATPALAANRLARWAVTLSQYDYSIEYRQSSKHGNTDALSRLPSGPDTAFDEREGDADIDSV